MTFIRDLFAVFQLAAGDDHIGAALGKGLDHQIAQAAAAAGNQNDLASEIEQRIQHCLNSPLKQQDCPVVERHATGLANGDRWGQR